MNKNKVAFLDRDGVINEDFGYVHLWQNFKFCDGVIDGMINLINLDFKLIIITNQSGIDRGLFSEYQYFKMTNLMLNHLKKFGVEITDIFYCPHHPNFSNKYFSNCNSIDQICLITRFPYMRDVAFPERVLINPVEQSMEKFFKDKYISSYSIARCMKTKLGVSYDINSIDLSIMKYEHPENKHYVEEANNYFAKCLFSELNKL